MARITGVAALLATLATTAAAQQAPGVHFDGERGTAVGRMLQQAFEGRGAAPPIGAVRQVSSGWDVRIEVGDPRGRRGPGSPSGNPWRYERVAALAHEVEERAEHLHRAAEGRSHHGDYGEERFLEAAHAFERQAAHFHRQLESYRQESYHTRSDYYELVSAFRQVEWTIRSAHVESHVWGDFNAARSAVTELEYYYRADGGYDHGHGHGDDDHDWPNRRRRPHGRW